MRRPCALRSSTRHRPGHSVRGGPMRVAGAAPRPDPPMAPGPDPGADVLPNPEPGGHHPHRCPQKCAGGPDQHVCIFKTDRADRGPDTGPWTANRWVGCGGPGDHPPHRRRCDLPSPGLAGVGPGDEPLSSHSGRHPHSTGALFGPCAKPHAREKHDPALSRSLSPIASKLAPSRFDSRPRQDRGPSLWSH